MLKSLTHLLLLILAYIEQNAEQNKPLNCLDRDGSMPRYHSELGLAWGGGPGHSTGSHCVGWESTYRGSLDHWPLAPHVML